MAYNYKSASNMRGPFPLTNEELVKSKYDNHGVYLLMDKGVLFDTIEYVGRGHLKSRIGDKKDRYTHFFYRTYSTKAGRYKKECEEYHRYGKSNELDNKIHPARPDFSFPLCTELSCNGEKY